MLPLLAIAVALASDSPSETWNAIVRSGVQLRDAGRIAEAKVKFEEALAVSRQLEPGDLRRWMALNQLGIIAHLEGRFDAAIPLFRDASRGYDVPSPERPVILVEILANLANSLLGSGRVDEASGVLRRAQTLEKPFLAAGELHSDRLLHGLAWVAVNQGRYLDARRLFEQELKVIEARNAGPAEIAAVLGSLGHVDNKRADYTQAEIFFRRALELRRQTFPAGHSVIFENMCSLATVLREAGHYDRAENILRQLVAEMQATPNPNPLGLATVITNLAVLLTESNRDREAQVLARRALAIYASIGQADSNMALINLQTLALILKHSKQPARAERVMKQVIAGWQRFDVDHPEQVRMLISLAEFYTQQKRFAEAERLFQRAVHLIELKFGPTHRDLVIALTAYAHLLKTMKRPNEATVLRKRADTLALASSGPAGSASIDRYELTGKR